MDKPSTVPMNWRETLRNKFPGGITYFDQPTEQDWFIWSGNKVNSQETEPE